MSQQAEFFALSKGARMHLKRRSDNRFYFRTSAQVKWIIWGGIGLICLPAPLLMSVVLDGGEQVFHLVSSVLLILFTALALGMRRHLVLDVAAQTLQLEKSWWGLGRSVQPQGALANQRAVVAPIAELSEGCLLEIAGQKYTIGSFDETCQLALFLHRHCGVPAFDRVSRWPQEVELLPARKPTPEPAAEAPLPPRMDSRPDDPATDTRTHFASVWEQRVLLKLALPFPVFLVLGGILSLLANRGGA